MNPTKLYLPDEWYEFENLNEASDVPLGMGDLVEIDTCKCMVMQIDRHKFMLMCLETGNRYFNTVVKSATGMNIKDFCDEDNDPSWNNFEENKDNRKVRIKIRG